MLRSLQQFTRRAWKNPAWKRRTRLSLGALFVFTGICHFWVPRMFLSIMPKWVPFPEAAVALSGAAEVAGGLGLLSKATRKPAGLGLVALLLLVFPANIQMLLWARKFPVPVWLLWLRLPLQPLLIWLVWWASQDETEARV
ncbi:DoxX family protein [Deinococcus roseus]|uniref:Membrane protein n=1 Tax=Deinococcus roseus TaxID=392414 RepID=A0ABQ2D4M9_9DEIO|nr:hypothetical protein [Deinococcus roseus]GGJ39344.1 membrane protein [Deinococcus roseus]